MHWNVAACQMKVSSNCSENLQSIIEHITEAKKKGADVICFPETCLIDDENDAKRITQELKAIRACASEHDINVIFGTYLIDAHKKIRNQVLVIDRNGDIVSRYNKEHKYMAESETVSAGHRNHVFVLDGVRCAAFICWDYAFPENMRKLASKGTDVIFCPSYLLSHPLTHDVLDKIPQVRAFDTMSYFVMVDACADKTYCRSKICHPLRCLAETSKVNDMIIAELDIADLDRVRKEFPNIKRDPPGTQSDHASRRYPQA